MDYHLLIEMNEKMQDLDYTVETKPQMFNPPVIHSLSVNQKNSKLAVGLGSGHVSIIGLKNCEITSEVLL